MLYSFDGRKPSVGIGTYVSETALVIGDVRIGDHCYIGHGAILRGDYGVIEIGNGTAVEEGVIIHAPPQDCCSIGNGVTIGHGAIIHAKLIGDRVGIGMGAIVKQGQKIPESILVAGNPAKKIRDVSQREKDFRDRATKIYRDLAHKYCELGMEKIERRISA